MSATGRLVRHAVDPMALLAAVSSPANGAILLFLGVVRDVNDGRAVTGIEYSGYEAMASQELVAIAGQCALTFGMADVIVEHRLGELDLEEVSVGIAIGHRHRAEAYEASRWVIEQLKRRVPIWKREQYADGTREWVNPTAYPAAAGAEIP